MIKRCNDFGAGGVSVAIGELADGLSIDLDAVPKKYDGPGRHRACHLANRQERMAVVVEAKDADALHCRCQQRESRGHTWWPASPPSRALSCAGRAVWSCDIAREFLNSNGAEKHARAVLAAPQAGKGAGARAPHSAENMHSLVAGLNVCSKKGLRRTVRFHHRRGHGADALRRAPPAHAHSGHGSISSPSCTAKRDTCAGMAWGYNPFISEKSPYHGAYLAVVRKHFEAGGRRPVRRKCLSYLPGVFRSALARTPPAGASPWRRCWARWTRRPISAWPPLAERIPCPARLRISTCRPPSVSFAVAAGETQDIVSPEFKLPGSKVVLLRPAMADALRPEAESLKAVWAQVHALMREGRVLAAYTPGMGGVAEALFKMCRRQRPGLPFGAGRGCRRPV